MQIHDLKPSQILLWSYPRTACHLLERMLGKQPDVQYCWHPFVVARPAQVEMLADDSIYKGIQESLRAQYEDRVSDGVRRWSAMLEETQAKGGTLFMHDHPCFALDPDRARDLVTKEWNQPYEKPEGSNYTLVPDELLLHPGTIPVSTIRHPAVTSPVIYRVTMAVEGEGSVSVYNVRLMSQVWQRELYDWYVSHGITPLVVEAEDYMSSSNFFRHLANEMGLCPHHCVFKWNAATKEEIKQMNPAWVKAQKTLVNSTGLVKEKVRPDINVETELVKWETEFGSRGAHYVKDLVDASTTHFEYLEKRKLKMPRT